MYFVDMHKILITEYQQYCKFSASSVTLVKKMDLEQLCLVLVPRPSDDWEDPVPQEKGSPEIDINTTYIVKFIETTIMVQTNLFILRMSYCQRPNASIPQHENRLHLKF